MPGVADFVENMQTEEAQAIYRLRGVVAEFPPGLAESQDPIRQFRVRVLKKVRCGALWACLAYNLSPWVRLRRRVPQAAAPV